MSTLNTTNLKNPSSGSNNIVLGTSGQTTVNGDLLFNSGYGSAATAYGCRAWVNFDGTGTVSTNQTIRGSGNVTSVFKNATGNFTVNFTTPMPDTNYCAVGSAGSNTTAATTLWSYYTAAHTAGSVRIGTGISNTGSNADYTNTAVAVFR